MFGLFDLIVQTFSAANRLSISCIELLDALGCAATGCCMADSQLWDVFSDCINLCEFELDCAATAAG